MDERELFEYNLKMVCKEIEQITEQIKKNGNVSPQHVEMLDKLWHLKKSILACHGMEHPEEYYEDDYHTSERRGRNSMASRYMSRDMDPGYSGNHYPYWGGAGGYSGYGNNWPPRW